MNGKPPPWRQTQKWGWTLAFITLLVIAFIAVGGREQLAIRCQNEWYLLSAIAQSLAAVIALVIASAAILTTSRHAVRRMASIVLQEWTVRGAFVLSFVVVATGFVLLRTSYEWWFLLVYIGFSIECLLLTAIAIYNIARLVEVNYFTEFLTAKLRRKNQHGDSEGSSSTKPRRGQDVYELAAWEWAEVLLHSGEDELLKNTLELIDDVRRLWSLLRNAIITQRTDPARLLWQRAKSVSRNPVRELKETEHNTGIRDAFLALAVFASKLWTAQESGRADFSRFARETYQFAGELLGDIGLNLAGEVSRWLGDVLNELMTLDFWLIPGEMREQFGTGASADQKYDPVLGEADEVHERPARSRPHELYMLAQATPSWALDSVAEAMIAALARAIDLRGVGFLRDCEDIISDLRIAAITILSRDAGEAVFAPAYWLRALSEIVWWRAKDLADGRESEAALRFLTKILGAYADVGAALFAASYQDSADSLRSKAAASWFSHFYMSMLTSGAFGQDEPDSFQRRLRDEMDNALLAALALTADEAKPYAAGLILSIAESTEPHVMNMNLQEMRRFFESSRLELAFSRLLTGEWYRDNAFIFLGRMFHETVAAYALLRAQFLGKPLGFTEQQLNDLRYLVNQHKYALETLQRLHTKELFRRTYDYRLYSWVRDEEPGTVHARLINWWTERKSEWQNRIGQIEAKANIDYEKIKAFARLAREGYCERRIIARLFSNQAEFLTLHKGRERFDGTKLIDGHKLLGYANPLPRDWFIKDSAVHTDMAAEQVGEGIATHEEYALGMKLRQLYESKDANRERLPRISADALRAIAKKLGQPESGCYYLLTTSVVHPEYDAREPSREGRFIQRWQEQQSATREASEKDSPEKVLSREARTYIGRWEKDNITIELHQLTHTDETRLPEGVFAMCNPDAMLNKLVIEDGLSVIISTEKQKEGNEVIDKFIWLKKDDYPNSVEMVVTLAFEMELNKDGIVFLLPDDYSDIII